MNRLLRRLPRLDTIDPSRAATAAVGLALGALFAIGVRVAGTPITGAPIAAGIAAAIVAGALIAGALLVRRLSADVGTLLIGSAGAVSAAALLFALRPLEAAGPAGFAPLISAWFMTLAVVGGPALVAGIGLTTLVAAEDGRARGTLALTGVTVGLLITALIGERLFDLDRLRLIATMGAILPAIIIMRMGLPTLALPSERRLPSTDLQLTELALVALPAALVSSVAIHVATVSIVLPLIVGVPFVAAIVGIRLAIAGVSETRLARLLPGAAAAIALSLPAAIAWPLGSELLLLGAGLLVVVVDAVRRVMGLPTPQDGRTLRLLTGIVIGLIAAPVVVTLLGERLAVAALLVATMAIRLRVPGMRELRETSLVRAALGRAIPFAVLSGIAIIGAGAIIGAVPAMTRFWILTIAAVAAIRSTRLLVVGTALPIVVALAVAIAPSLELRGPTGTAAAYGDRLSPTSWVANGPALVGIQRHTDTTRSSAGAYDRSAPIGQVVALIDTRGGTQSILAIGLAGGDAASYATASRSIRFFEPLPELAALVGAGRVTSYLADAPAAPTVTVGRPRGLATTLPAASADLVIVDARFGWSIPAEHVTVEGLAEWARVAGPRGLIAVHLSARGVDLEGPLAAAAAELGLTALVRTDVPASSPDGTRIPSTWMVIAADGGSLEQLRASTSSPFRLAVPTRAWRDRQIDLIGALRLLP